MHIDDRSLLCGFISDGELNELLRAAEPGDFLVKFQEGQPGTLAVVYKAPLSPPPAYGSCLRCYIISDASLGPTFSLPDFIAESAVRF